MFVIIVAIAVAMGVIGGIGLAVSANVWDRTREFGVMHRPLACTSRIRFGLGHRHRSQLRIAYDRPGSPRLPVSRSLADPQSARNVKMPLSVPSG